MNLIRQLHKFLWFCQNQILSLGILYTFFPRLILISSAISSLLTLRLCRIRRSICSLTSTRLRSKGTRNARHDDSAVLFGTFQLIRKPSRGTQSYRHTELPTFRIFHQCLTALGVTTHPCCFLALFCSRSAQNALHPGFLPWMLRRELSEMWHQVVYKFVGVWMEHSASIFIIFRTYLIDGYLFGFLTILKTEEVCFFEIQMNYRIIRRHVLHNCDFHVKICHRD
jgi:hypothetical protein